MRYYVFYFVIINIVSYCYYGIDKYLAMHRKSRISETWLLFLGVLGGSLGSILGMYKFRHKTKRFKFYFFNYGTLFIWSVIHILFIINR